MKPILSFGVATREIVPHPLEHRITVHWFIDEVERSNFCFAAELIFPKNAYLRVDRAEWANILNTKIKEMNNYGLTVIVKEKEHLKETYASS